MRRYFYWLPVLTYMGIIFYFSNKPGSQISLPTPDYIAHGAEYFGLGFLTQWALRGWNKTNPAHRLTNPPGLGSYLGVLAFCILYGLSDEFHQGFIPGRSPSLSDLAADTTGAALAQICWWLWTYIHTRNSISKK
ncbi:MAG TPA: VanZ family protein [Bacillota bacterium]|nr:VanZ family protein [Bacillota bacterium]